MPQRFTTPPRLGAPHLGPLTRRVLFALVGLYLLQTVAESWLHLPVLATLAWWPPSSGLFRPWQPLTAFLLSGPAPVEAFLGWLMIAFFLPPAEASLGPRGLYRLLGAAWLAALLGTLPLSFLGAVGGSAYLGPHAFVAALLAAFGLARPNATVLLFFVLPVRASWIAWGTGLFSLLYLLYGRSLASAVSLFGWLGAVVVLLGGPSALLWRWRHRRLRRSRRELFQVLPGGRSDDDGPLFH